jgi:ABC-2 type transport system permease protein
LLAPRDSLPGVLSAVSDVLPLSYAVDGMKTLATVPNGSGDVLWDVLIVLAFVAGAVVLGAATLRRRTA